MAAKITIFPLKQMVFLFSLTIMSFSLSKIKNNIFYNILIFNILPSPIKSYCKHPITFWLIGFTFLL